MKTITKNEKRTLAALLHIVRIPKYIGLFTKTYISLQLLSLGFEIDLNGIKL
jgi:hypothetical protein